jgi:spore coat protein U-like protein
MRFPIAVFSIVFAGLSLSTSALALTTCQIVVNRILFGGYNPLLYSAPVNTTGSVDVSCKIEAVPLSTVVSYSIGISTGLSGNATSRRMFQGSDFLTYNIFVPPGASAIWGDLPSGNVVIGGFSGFTQLGSFRTNNHPMNAVLNPRQTGKPLGDYLDDLNVTVYF